MFKDNYGLVYAFNCRECLIILSWSLLTRLLLTCRRMTDIVNKYAISRE